MRILLLLCLLLSLGGTANAHVYSTHSHHHVGRQHVDLRVPVSHRLHIAGRPSAWCGWAMRQLVPSDPGSEYNLAKNWKHYGQPADGPAVGRIVVWPHHVAMIVGYDTKSKLWITHEGNYSHAWHLGPRRLVSQGSAPIAYRSL